LKLTRAGRITGMDDDRQPSGEEREDDRNDELADSPVPDVEGPNTEDEDTAPT
jgi:hypothetical protein